MVKNLSWLILIILPCIMVPYTTTTNINIQTQTTTIQTLPSSTQPQSQKNNGDIDYRLTRLEILLEESTRRQQALEFQVHSTLEALRADLAKIVQTTPSGPTTPTQLPNTLMVQATKDLHKDVKTLMAVLTSDVNDLKRNVSSLFNDTRSMLQSTSDFVTKQFFNQSLLDLQPQHPSFPIHSELPTGMPKNCRELKESGQTHTGIYTIQPERSLKPVLVVCDMQTRGGGWTVVHNRFDGSQDFYQNWQQYKYGFGNLTGEFWLGLDTIHLLTGYQTHELLIELQDFDLQNKTAYYASFNIGPELEGFPIKNLKGFCGDAGDSLLAHHNGHKFSTKDVDQDLHDYNCADYCGGAWWYHACATSNLNGKYLKGTVQDYKGMFWKTFRGDQYSLLKARMLVRPRAEVCDAF